MLNMLLLSLTGGIISLDRIFLQIMISRPIVCAPLAGLLLGDVYAGLMVGALLELFWIDHLPIGTCVPPNDFLVAFVAASASVMAGQRLGGTSRELIALSVIIFIPCGGLGQWMDNYLFKSNDALSHAALECAGRADTGGIGRKHMTGFFRYLLFYGVLIFLLLFAGSNLLAFIYPLLPSFILSGLMLTYFALPLIGVAAGLNTIKLKGLIPLFCGFFIAASLLLELIHVF